MADGRSGRRLKAHRQPATGEVRRNVRTAGTTAGFDRPRHARYDRNHMDLWLSAPAVIGLLFYEVPHVGHGVVRSTACGLSVGLEFLNDPTTEPDTSCIAEMLPPEFR